MQKVYNAAPTFYEGLALIAGVFGTMLAIVFIGIPAELERQEKYQTSTRINLTAACQRGSDSACGILKGIEQLEEGK